MSRFAAVVLAAGAGKRMNSDVPKQFLPLAGKPVIYYSLKAFEQSGVSEIVLVTGKEEADYCRSEIVEKYHFHKISAVVPGGKERYHSVYEGLKAVEDAEYVLIHDGARPFLTQEIIARSMETVQTEKACAAGMPVKDTIKELDEQQYAVRTPERSRLWTVQTPQSFSVSLIREAYEKFFAMQQSGQEVPALTDDAMVVEHVFGRKVRMIEGSYKNIKITTPEDLPVAELFLDLAGNALLH